jgi:CTP synthase
MAKKKPIFVFISGGVISGLGKGITTASLALLLKSAGLKVSVMKVDMYLNVDAGTMNPLEHGEVFVTEDGVETDQDIGHYERFLDQNLLKENYLTAGQVYLKVIRRERHLDFNGECVDAYIHIPQEVIRHWEKLGRRNDFVLIEMGGTVGEYQNVLFFEAARRLKIKYPDRVFFVHVVYLPIPRSIGEIKSKPAQQSITNLNALGIYPNFVVCRAELPVDARRRRKIALAAALPEERIFSAPDVDPIYRVPMVLKEQGLDKVLLKVTGQKAVREDLRDWKRQLKKIEKADRIVRVGIVGKYYRSGSFSLEDSYVSVVEAVKHASLSLNCQPQIVWLDSESLEEKRDFEKVFSNVDAIIVPGGFGSRGVEGKIMAIAWARENKVPFLGLCYGMQLATVEFARHVLGWKDAHTVEIDPKTTYPVIHLMPEQEKKMLAKDYGGTMRLGAWPCWLRTGTNASDFYTRFGWVGKRGKKIAWERHRHRYEFNNYYRKRLEKAGLVIAGTTPDDQIVEVIELPKKAHPFFVGVQFHPEFKSRFLRPHPLFLGLINAAVRKK